MTESGTSDTLASPAETQLFEWTELSPDPNAPEVAQARRELLDRSRAPTLVRDRIEHLCRLAAGKRVLDVGCVEHHHQAATSDSWLHAHLAEAAGDCLGVDILEEEVRLLRDAGHNVICHDLLAEPLEATFDLIVCGELLEHLGSPQSLLDSLAVMLAPGGQIVVTTPNPWYANVLLKNVFSSRVFVDSADHVAWYEPAVMLELSRRSGLRLTYFAGLAATPSESLLSRAFFSAAPLLKALGVRREVFAKTMVYHLER